MDKSACILVVDDNQENLKVVSNFLKEEGYKIALALDGESALAVLDENAIDLILLDVMMPGMDGFEVCAKIKKDNALKEIPIIFLTAKNNTEDIVKGFQLGGVDYITKPFIRDEMLVRVHTHLELSLSKKELLETIKNRDKLYSIIAHDIRTPFIEISMVLNTLANGYVKMGSPEFNEMLQLLEKSAKSTSTLLSNLLDWTKLQVGALTLNPQLLPISYLINDCVQLLSGSAQSKNIQIESHIESDAVAYFDDVTMHTVFRNLIVNAIKFTPQNGKITIDARSDSRYLLVNIADTGVGISKDVQQKIFEKNEYLTTRGTSNESGSGLGLHLVKDLTEQNKGTISVESEVGKGSVFTVAIPVKDSEQYNY
jgi:two-component system sensor histidine kinase/response regulator